MCAKGNFKKRGGRPFLKNSGERSFKRGGISPPAKRVFPPAKGPGFYNRPQMGNVRENFQESVQKKGDVLRPKGKGGNPVKRQFRKVPPLRKKDP